jgi:CubicO group peptidase (beta-lactamase class C family)
MAAKVAGCCEGLLSSIDEVPTISEIMHKAIMDQTFPGGTVAFGSCTVPCYYQAYGTYTFESSIGVTLESGWDMASLTKIMVTTPCVMVLYDRDLIALEQVACKYLPEFGNNGKEIITVRQLLTHTAGLHEFYPFFDMGLTKREEVIVQLQFLDRLIWNISSNALCQEFLFASCRPQ